jgi:hypothetical protein
MNAQRLKPFPFICKKILKVFHLQKVHHAKIKFLLILLQMAILEIAPAEEEGRKSGFSFQHSLSTSFPSSHSGPLITNHKQHPDGRDFHSERMGGLGPSSSSSAYSVSSSTAIGHHRRRASLTG